MTRFSFFTTGELRARGETRQSIRDGIDCGSWYRVIKGWYATSASPEDAVLAMRIGGRLGCVSALELHGAWVPPASGVHVVFPTGASDRRTAGRTPGPSIIRHWSAPWDRTGSAFAVAPLEVDDWLTIEADGRAAHAREAALTADRQRVVRLMRHGRIVLQFACAAIMYDFEAVLTAVEDVMARHAPLG